jgi:hypothetical protein
VKRLLLKLLVFLFWCNYPAHAQKIASGKYVFTVTSAEWNGKKMGTCIVIVAKDSVKIISDGSVGGKKGEVWDAGILARHKKTGSWIVCHSHKDIYAEEVGGCSDGPHVLNFIKKIFDAC